MPIQGESQGNLEPWVAAVVVARYAKGDPSNTVRGMVNWNWVTSAVAIAGAESDWGASSNDYWQDTNCTMVDGQPAAAGGKSLQEQANTMYAVWRRTGAFWPCWGTARPGSSRYYRKAQFWGPAASSVRSLRKGIAQDVGTLGRVLQTGAGNLGRATKGFGIGLGKGLQDVQQNPVVHGAEDFVNVFGNIFGAVAFLVGWITSPANWLRLGMALAGALLFLGALYFMAKEYSSKGA